MSISIFEIS